jgi:hypothetical protein
MTLLQIEEMSVDTVLLLAHRQNLPVFARAFMISLEDPADTVFGLFSLQNAEFAGL